MKVAREHFSKKAGRTSDGYSGDDIREYRKRESEFIIGSGLKLYQLKVEDLQGLPKGDWRKSVIAHVVQKRTTARLDWIADQLGMGSRGYCSRKIKTASETEPGRKEISRLEKMIQTNKKQ